MVLVWYHTSIQKPDCSVKDEVYFVSLSFLTIFPSFWNRPPIWLLVPRQTTNNTLGMIRQGGKLIVRWYGQKGRLARTPSVVSFGGNINTLTTIRVQCRPLATQEQPSPVRQERRGRNLSSETRFRSTKRRPQQRSRGRDFAWRPPAHLRRQLRKEKALQYMEDIKKAKSADQVMEILEHMKQESFYPDSMHFTAAITACGRKGDALRSVALLDEMVESGVPPNIYSYSAAMHAVASQGFHDTAMEVWERIQKDETVTPDLTCYNLALNIFAKAGETEQILDTLREMHKNKIESDDVTYSTAINCFGKTGNWEKALELLNRQKESGIPPSQITFTAALSACQKAGRWEESLQLLEDMKATRIQPDEIASRIALVACFRAAQFRAALNLVGPMLRHRNMAPLQNDTLQYDLYDIRNLGYPDACMTIVSFLLGSDTKPSLNKDVAFQTAPLNHKEDESDKRPSVRALVRKFFRTHRGPNVGEAKGEHKWQVYLSKESLEEWYDSDNYIHFRETMLEVHEPKPVQGDSIAKLSVGGE